MALQDLHREGRTVVMVTHEEDVAALRAIVRFRDGEIYSDTRAEPRQAGANVTVNYENIRLAFSL